MRDKKLALLIALGIIALFSLIYGIKTPSKYRRPSSSPSANSVPVASGASSLKSFVPLERHAKRSNAVDWGRNPFLLEKAEAQAFANVVLNGIAWDEKNPKAIINDRICELGEVVGGRKIVKIEQNRVVLNDGVENLELRLGQKK